MSSSAAPASSHTVASTLAPTSPSANTSDAEQEPVYPTSEASFPAPPTSAAAAAVKFVQVLGHTAGVDRTAWTNALTPLCSTQFGNQLALSSPSEIADQAVTGAAQLVGANALLDAAYFVPTTTGGMTVWIDYSNPPGLVTGAAAGKHKLAEGG